MLLGFERFLCRSREDGDDYLYLYLHSPLIEITKNKPEPTHPAA